jgi:hypothetical protein
MSLPDVVSVLVAVVVVALLYLCLLLRSPTKNSLTLGQDFVCLFNRVCVTSELRG